MARLDLLKLNRARASEGERLNYAASVLYGAGAVICEGITVANFPHPTRDEICLSVVMGLLSTYHLLRGTEFSIERSHLETELEAAERDGAWLWDEQRGV